MSTSISRLLVTRPLLLAAAMMAFAGSALAQTQAQPRDNQKSCQASTKDANGNAKDGNLDGTYSACSLADGFISGSTRANDGKKPTPEFAGKVSDQELRKFDFDDGTHRLAIKTIPGKSATTSGGKLLSTDDNGFRFGTRDFVAAEQIYPLDELGANGAAGRAQNGRAVSTSSNADSETPLGNASGVGTGGAGGGLIPTAPAVPAVPEPETWAMLLAGLGLVVLAGRRKQALKA
ncbi:PEP-CTERM sorting domain-containing protein [Janthinobacterium sp. PC23-8]|uniref:PEP-CTERM sorting domain-containing protein n=1 Tax=Janthinobacterium sp. PC23-8 TaxID=2012679 RepID=UPI0020CE9200|nr:PEP-CTERM sorting domain-containing protein [Janthinobacterium sp. PC23-8]